MKSNKNKNGVAVVGNSKQIEESIFVKQKQVVVSILKEINDPTTIKKIFTYVWTITH